MKCLLKSGLIFTLALFLLVAPSFPAWAFPHYLDSDFYGI
jgi:hypothetical protein